MEKNDLEGNKGFVRASNLEKHPILRVLDGRRRRLFDDCERIEDELTRIDPGDVGQLDRLVDEWRELNRRREAYDRVVRDLRENRDVLDELQRRVEA